MRKQRIFMLMCFFLFVYIGLLLRFFYFQAIKGEELAGEAAAMHSQHIALKEYSRGDILDRNLLPLTDAALSNALYCSLPETTKNLKIKYGDNVDETVLRRRLAGILAHSIDQDEEKILNKISEAARKGEYFVKIADNLSDDQIRRINANHLPGLTVAPVTRRYDSGGFCSHLLGYVAGEDGFTGISGIEKQYDQLLKQNTDANQLVAVLDARGDVIQGLMFKIRKEQSDQNGSVVLTLDRSVQGIVETAMNRNVSRGAVVVMDIKNKEVLAMASRPNFNPYDVQTYTEDSQSPLYNRALNKYFPGSLFKIVVTAAALENDVVAPDDRFFCSGKYNFSPDFFIPCWKKGGHGVLTFAEAFAQSCNPTFIQVGLKLEKDRLLEYVKKIHVADETLLGYNDYKAGSEVSINPGDRALANACLGQQGVMLTPLEIASLISTVADDGQWAPPALVRYTVDQQGRKSVINKPAPQQVIKKETAQTIRQLMEKVVNEGTGKTAVNSEVRIAGKTATSQTGELDNNKEILNTWFGGYFPAENPRWAVVVLAEEGESGAQNAAPVFKEIAEKMVKLLGSGT